MKCKICGKRFKLIKDKRYEVVKTPTKIAALTEEEKCYECFDCPNCGCQNIVNIREVQR